METSNKPLNKPGGWRGSPNSIAALLASQVLLQFQRKCSRCGRVAMRGRRTCVFHGGKRLRDIPGRPERRRLLAMIRLGLIPPELEPGATRCLAPAALHLALLWHDRERQALAFAQAWRLWCHAAQT